MDKWYHIFSKSTGLGLYVWIMFCMVPFYFVFRASTPLEITFGILIIMLFFAAYRLAFLRNGWIVYASLCVEMAIHIGMTIFFGYVYFAIFLAYYIGNSNRKAKFITLYVIHLVTTIAAVSIGFVLHSEMFLYQLPFIIITLIGVILMPLNMYHTNNQRKLEDELQHANERIAELLVMEERHRIARDLHDTLGQKLSLIGMKSDLSSKLVKKEPNRAIQEIKDIQQTARTALKELREIVSTMRSVNLHDELIRIRQMLETAQINFELRGDPELEGTPILVETVLSMCLKEAVTNIVKHSQAKNCIVTISQKASEVVIEVRDDGIGFEAGARRNGHGLRGIRERLEFVNGQVHIASSENGTTIRFQVPKVTMGTTDAINDRKE